MTAFSLRTFVDEALECVVLDEGGFFRSGWTGGVHVGATACLLTGCVGCVGRKTVGLVGAFAVIFAVVFAVVGMKVYGRGDLSGATGTGLES